MWREVYGGDDVDRSLVESVTADDDQMSRRISTASEDSFDASSYAHVENKLSTNMPKCLIETDGLESRIKNHFSLKEPTANGGKVAKNGKRVIRKRLSASQFKATRMRENGGKNCNNNSSVISDSANNNDTSSSSECDSLRKQDKQSKKSKDVLSAKIQHLLFEMKRLRQLDRDILRKFLVINDTIEEQKWMVEEKQEAIKKSLSEEGEDLEGIDMNFDLEPEVLEGGDDDEESIQSVLSRQNSGCEVFDETLPIDLLGCGSDVKTDPEVDSKSKEADFISTSSDSALSLSGVSSTLSSNTSFPRSNHSSSPPTSHLSGSSPTSSFVSSNGQKSEPVIENPPTPQPQQREIPDDIEGYYRMYGSSIKRGSYPFPRTSYNGTQSLSYQGQVNDDISVTNGYTTQSNGFQYAVRKNLVSQSYSGSFPQESVAHARPVSASAASMEVDDFRNRAKRISVRPDGTHETFSGLPGVRRPLSANDKTSYRLLQHPIHQKRSFRLNNRQTTNWAFVPIAEQEPDVMCENGRLHSGDSDTGPEKKEFEVLVDLSRPNSRWSTADYRSLHSRQCPAPRRKPSGAGSAGSLTSSSSRTSSSSLASSGSNSSLHSPTKFLTNEPDYRPAHHQAPVWIQRRRHSVQDNEYIAIPYNQSFPAPFLGSSCHGNGARVHNLPDTNQSNSFSQKSKLNPRSSVSLSRSTTFGAESDHILTVSYKPKTNGTNEAVFNWIQTQDDVTYL